jgi:hypothetical protein
MKAINFEQVNKVLKADGCHDLPVCFGGTNIVICWQLSWRERLRLLVTGRLWHLIWAEKAMIQPVLVTVDTPFASKMPVRPKGRACFSEQGINAKGFPFEPNCIVTQWNVPDEKWGRKTEILLVNGRYVAMPHAEMLNFLHPMED